MITVLYTGYNIKHKQKMSFVCSLCMRECDQLFAKNTCVECYLRCHAITNKLVYNNDIYIWATDRTPYGSVCYYNYRHEWPFNSVDVVINKQSLQHPQLYPTNITNLGDTCIRGHTRWR